MTQKKALKLRTIFDALFSFVKDGRYGVAIQKRFVTISSDDYEVHIFVRNDGLSGLLTLGLLAHTMEMLNSEFLAVESSYDLGTIKGEHVVQSWKIW